MAFMRHNNNGGRRHNHNNRHRGGHNNGGQNQQGQHGQNGQRRYVNRINQVFDSNGPDGRIRGTAQQIVEKFASLARDASAAGDKVLMQNYYQHAEHYQRLLNEILEENAVFEREREAQRQATAAQNPQPDMVSDNPDVFAAAPVPATAAATATDDAASLPAFVQVPISAAPPIEKHGENPVRAGLRGRGPRRNADDAATPDTDA